MGYGLEIQASMDQNPGPAGSGPTKAADHDGRPSLEKVVREPDTKRSALNKQIRSKQEAHS